MSLSLSSYPKSFQQVESLRQRCSRGFTLLGSCWNMLGILLITYPVGENVQTPLTHRLHILGLCAMMIAAAIYSIMFTMNWVLREISSE